MKIFIFLLLVSSKIWATTIAQIISKSEGSSIQQFQINSGKVVYEKRSNFFDKKNDFSLGKFSSDYKLSDKDQKKVESILAKIKSVNEFMAKKKSSFNDLSVKNPHESLIMLDDYKVGQGSDLYHDLKVVFDTLLEQKWAQESGIKLTDDYQSIITFKGGKEISREPFNFAFHCQKSEAPTFCLFKGHGLLYLPKL